jgi:hypothetical protein
MSTHYGIGRGARDKYSIYQVHNHNHSQTKVEQKDKDGNEIFQHRNYTFVVQKLIEKPLLYLNRKFDIRQWVLFNAADGKAYIYREAYVRTSSKIYADFDPAVSNEEYLLQQLTNNAIQKMDKEYQKYEEGNIISVGTLFSFIARSPQSQGKSVGVLQGEFKEAMEKLIVDSLKAVRGKLRLQQYTFELFGYDFILDEQMNTILIECNTNPCLEESNTLLKNLLPRMVDDMFSIVMDPLFGAQGGSDSKGKGKYKSKFKLPGEVFGETANHPGYSDDENLWKHIYTMEN